MRREIFASVTSFNPAFGLLKIKGIIGECGMRDEVHTFFYSRNITKKNNFFRFEIEEGHVANSMDDYGPNHNGTIVWKVQPANRFMNTIRYFFVDKAALAKQELLK